MEAKEPRSNSVKSILKAFAILEELDRGVELSLAEVSERLAMDKGTAFRLLATMREAGYVTQNPESKRYSNSLKLFAMGNRVADHSGFRQIARPFLEELAEKSGETANLSLRIGNDMVFVDKVETTETIKAGLSIGITVPMYCTGMGKAVLAFMKEEEAEAVIDGFDFRPYTKDTVTSKEELNHKLAEVRKQGFCLDVEEYVESLICFAAPIFDYHRNPVGAISVSSPKFRYDPERTDEEFSRLIKETAAKISRQIGYNA